MTSRIDWTTIAGKITPRQGDEIRHRTAIVDVVNGDGTVDILLGDSIVENVAKLAGATATLGATVHVLTFGGDLLVLGEIAT